MEEWPLFYYQLALDELMKRSEAYKEQERAGSAQVSGPKPGKLSGDVLQALSEPAQEDSRTGPPSWLTG